MSDHGIDKTCEDTAEDDVSVEVAALGNRARNYCSTRSREGALKKEKGKLF